MEKDTYLTIKSFSEGLFKEKGSRFQSYAFYIRSVEEVKNHLDQIKKEHHNARHHCFAYILGYERLQFRFNDDGEPSGSAGKPILGQINSHGLTNILIIVVRYFGGKLLGISGLIHAYRSAAESAINNAEIVTMTIQEHYSITFPYISINDVMKVLKEENVSISESEFNTICLFRISFRISAGERIINRFSRIEGLELRHTGRS
jgi:uncharacterized YigZ family protein